MDHRRSALDDRMRRFSSPIALADVVVITALLIFSSSPAVGVERVGTL